MQEPTTTIEVTPENFQSDVVERSRSVPVVLLFWTDQVAPAVEMKNLLERLVAQYQGKFLLALSDIGQDQLIAQQLRIQGIPSVRVIRDGQLADQLDGPQGEAALRELLDQLTMSSGELLQASLDDVIEAGDWDQATAILQQALNEEPNNPWFKVEWADVLVCKGDAEGARSVLATIADDVEDKKRPQTRLELLEESLAMPALEECEARFDKDPDDLECRYNLGVRLAVQRQYDTALHHLMFILQTDRTFRDDIGRESMIRVMDLMGKDSPVAQSYRRRMFSYLY